MTKPFGLVLAFLFLVLLTACQTEEQKLKVAEKVAERFARFWEQKDYASMYNMFIPELQKIKSKEEFIETLEFEEKERNVVVRLDKVSKDNDTTAYVYYTITSSLFNSKAPAMKLEFRDGDWKVDAFGGYFNEDIKKVKRIAKATEFIKKAGEKRDKFNEISRDSLLTLKLFNIRADSEYCIDFDSQARRTKDILDEFQNLDVPQEPEYKKFYNVELKFYNLSYFMIDETKGYCDTITNPKGIDWNVRTTANQHLENAQKFGDLASKRASEAQAILKSLNSSIFSG